MKKYKVTYWFIDSTYWDDGNRSTKRCKEFILYSDAVSFARDIVAKGVTETSNISGKTAKFCIDKDNFIIEEITTKHFPWWAVLDDFDHLVKTIRNYLKYDNFKALANFEAEITQFYDREHFKKALTVAKESSNE